MPKSAWGALQWCPVQWQSFGVQIRENQLVESESEIPQSWSWVFNPLRGLMDWGSLFAGKAGIYPSGWVNRMKIGCAFAPFVYFVSFNLKLEMSQKASQSHDWYWLVRTSLAQNSWRRFAFFFFTVVRNSKNDGIWWERKVDSCPLYLLDLFLLHPKELTNSIHESTCSFNLEILEVSNIESGSWPMFTSWMGSSWELHHPLTLWFQGPWPTFLGRISYTSMACFMEEIHLFFFLYFANLPLESSAQCTIYIHLPPFTSNPLTRVPMVPQTSPNRSCRGRQP